jgi:hypothetical protein
MVASGTRLKDRMVKVQTTLVASPRFEPTPRFSGKDDYGGFAPPLPRFPRVCGGNSAKANPGKQCSRQCNRAYWGQSKMGKVILVVIGVALIAVALSITGKPGGGLNSLLVVAARIGAFLIGCAFAYQAYDAFRSAWTGTQPRASCPRPRP